MSDSAPHGRYIEVDRREDVDAEAQRVRCVRCGGRVVLHWNGGELEEVTCCGHLYSFQAVRLDVVIYRAEGDPSVWSSPRIPA